MIRSTSSWGRPRFGLGSRKRSNFEPRREEREFTSFPKPGEKSDHCDRMERGRHWFAPHLIYGRGGWRYLEIVSNECNELFLLSSISNLLVTQRKSTNLGIRAKEDHSAALK